MADKVPEKTIAAADVVRLVLACEPSVVDEPAIRSVLGDAAAKTLTEVAKTFGRSYTTVKTSWRPSGMPAESSTCYRLADVLIWWLNREVANKGARGRGEMAERKQAADTMAAETAAKRQQRAFEREEGKYQSVEVVRSEWNAGLAVVSNEIMGIPRELKPGFCKKCAETMAIETERRLRNALTRISERTVAEVLPNGANGHAG